VEGFDEGLRRFFLGLGGGVGRRGGCGFLGGGCVGTDGEGAKRRAGAGGDCGAVHV
jgi:hypothetical protein